ncbi:hypothetical protein DBR06_SOUSAS14010194, partial [Sousa chinensis]
SRPEPLPQARIPDISMFPLL